MTNCGCQKLLAKCMDLVYCNKTITLKIYGTKGDTGCLSSTESVPWHAFMIVGSTIYLSHPCSYLVLLPRLVQVGQSVGSVGAPKKRRVASGTPVRGPARTHLKRVCMERGVVREAFPF